MYTDVKSNAINESEVRRIAGDKSVDEVLAINCEFTSRVIDDCYEVEEMSASVDVVINGDDCTLTVLYLVDKQAAHDCDDLGDLDYSNYTFVID